MLCKTKASICLGCLYSVKSVYTSVKCRFVFLNYISMYNRGRHQETFYHVEYDTTFSNHVQLLAKLMESPCLEDVHLDFLPHSK